MKRRVRIKLRSSGTVIADGPLGWGITPFEGNFYISRKYLLTDKFKPNFIPGLCIYKFFYVWMDFEHEDGAKIPSLGWLYWLPNPLLPFIWFRVAVARGHPDISYEEYSAQL
jgi:uncharacterized protein (DUF427 family)